MNKEFCLSNYIWNEEDGEMITKEKVREFIRLILSELDFLSTSDWREVEARINKLAGEKLI